MARPGNTSIVLVYALVLASLGVLVMAVISPDFEDEASVALALRLTAKLAFFVYLAIFMARPFRELFANSITHALVRNRPYLGTGFAAIMTAHLALIAWWFVFVTGQGLPAGTLIVGGVTYLLILLMLITTFEAPARALGPTTWRRLHKTGLYVVGAVFLNALIPDVIAMPSDPVYLATGILIVVAIAVRVWAYLKRRRQNTAATESAR